MTTMRCAPLPNSLVDSASSGSQAVRIGVFWRSGFGGRPEGGGGHILSKSRLLLLISSMLSTLALNTKVDEASNKLEKNLICNDIPCWLSTCAKKTTASKVYIPLSCHPFLYYADDFFDMVSVSFESSKVS